ncbi:unnamed protein product, partial [marine sediment metagenome]
MLPGTIELVKLETELYHALFLASKYISGGSSEDKIALEKSLSTMTKYKTKHHYYHFYEDIEHLEKIEEIVQVAGNFITELILLKKKGAGLEDLHILQMRMNKAIGENLTPLINSYVEHHIREADERVKITKRETTAFRKIMIIASMAILFLALIISFFIAQLISKPIIKLKETSQKITEGNLDYKIEVRSKDEVGELAHSFNKMTNNLQKTTVSLDYA